MGCGSASLFVGKTNRESARAQDTIVAFTSIVSGRVPDGLPDDYSSQLTNFSMAKKRPLTPPDTAANAKLLKIDLISAHVDGAVMAIIAMEPMAPAITPFKNLMNTLFAFDMVYSIAHIRP